MTGHRRGRARRTGWAAAALAAALLQYGLASRPAGAQEAAPAAVRAAMPRLIPFEFSSGKIFVDVMVNGQGPYPFALDTGSPPTILDMDLARELGLEVTPMGRVGGAGEGSTPMGAIAGARLELGGFGLSPRMLMGVALNSRLSGYNGRPIMGLIGNDFIGSRVVEIDYANRALTIHDPAAWEYDGDGSIVPTRRRGHTFFTGRVAFPGQEPLRARFLLDTGAGVTAALTTPFVRKHGLMELAGETIPATVGFGLGGEVRQRVCRLDSLTMGPDIRIGRPVVSLSEDRAGALASAEFDGIVGGEILSKFRVILDGPGNRMILEPSRSFADPLEFDMSGIGLSADAPGGRLRVLRVEDGSPAAEAGIRENDTIMAIDGRKVWSEDRDYARERLKGDGEGRKIRLLRGDEVVEVVVRLRRMV